MRIIKEYIGYLISKYYISKKYLKRELTHDNSHTNYFNHTGMELPPNPTLFARVMDLNERVSILEYRSKNGINK